MDTRKLGTISSSPSDLYMERWAITFASGYYVERDGYTWVEYMDNKTNTLMRTIPRPIGEEPSSSNGCTRSSWNTGGRTIQGSE